ERLRVAAVAIGQHDDFVAYALGLAPGIHDEHIVDRHAGDGIHAFGVDLIGELDEPGKVLRIASGREGARYREQHHGLALEELVRTHVLGALLGHALEGARGHAIACLDGHTKLLNRRFNPRLRPTLRPAWSAGPRDSRASRALDRPSRT